MLAKSAAGSSAERIFSEPTDKRMRRRPTDAHNVERVSPSLQGSRLTYGRMRTKQYEHAKLKEILVE